MENLIFVNYMTTINHNVRNFVIKISKFSYQSLHYYKSSNPIIYFQKLLATFQKQFLAIERTQIKRSIIQNAFSVSHTFLARVLFSPIYGRHYCYDSSASFLHCSCWFASNTQAFPPRRRARTYITRKIHYRNSSLISDGQNIGRYFLASTIS